MARLNVYLPDELAMAVSERLPGLNVSATLQATLGGLLECDHHAMSCTSCTVTLERVGLERGGLAAFFAELAAELEPLVWRGATAQGAAGAVWAVGRRYGIAGAAGPLPRPTRAELERRAEGDWTDQQRRESA